MFAWLKMTEICTSSFDGDEYYDINLIDELEMIIWCSSVALESADEADEIIDCETNQFGSNNFQETHIHRGTGAPNGNNFCTAMVGTLSEE